MRVQIFETGQGGHYTNYIEHLLRPLVALLAHGLVDEITV